MQEKNSQPNYGSGQRRITTTSNGNNAILTNRVANTGLDRTPLMKNNKITTRNKNPLAVNRNALEQGRLSDIIKFNRKTSNLFRIPHYVRPRPSRYPVLNTAYDFIPNPPKSYRGIDAASKNSSSSGKASVDIWSNRNFHSTDTSIKMPPNRYNNDLTILTPQHIPLPNGRNRTSTSNIQSGPNDVDLKKYYIRKILRDSFKAKHDKLGRKKRSLSRSLKPVSYTHLTLPTKA